MGVAIATNVGIKLGLPVYFASVEMSRVEVAMRMCCSMGRVDSQLIRTGKLRGDDIDRIREAGEKLRKSPIWIDDAGTQTATKISAHARRLKARGGLSLVVVDYIQLLDGEDRRQGRREQVEAASRRMKMLAKEIQAPVVCMAQLNRQADQRDLPRLSDLREAGGLEQDADTVILLHRDRDQDVLPVQRIDAIIAKQRNGPVGIVPLAYTRKFTEYGNLANAEFHPEL